MQHDVTATVSSSSATTTSISTFHIHWRKFYPWLVWGIGASFFFFEYIVRVSPGVMAASLMRDFHVTAFALSGLTVFFYYAYVGMQVPVGALVDRFGVRRLLTIMAIVTSIGCVLFASANSVFNAEMGRLLMGFGAAFAFVSALKIAAEWFPASRVGLLAGLTQALGMLGAAFGEAPTAFVVTALGWRQSMFLMAIVFIGLAVLIFAIIRDKPKTDLISNKSLSNAKSNETVADRFKVVFTNPQTWINALYVGLLYAPTAALAELWGPLYFEQAFGFSHQVAASAVMFIFIGWGVGGPIVGWLSDRLQCRRPIMLTSAALGFAILSIIIFSPHLTVTTLFILLFLYGISNTGVAISYAVAAEINPRSMAGTSLGFTNMASVILGASFQPLIGWLLDWQADSVMIDGVMHYSPVSFRYAMAILPICLGLSIVCALFVRETFKTSSV